MSLRRRSWRMLQGFSLGLTAGTAGLSMYFIHQNNYDISSIGAVRFARAGYAVARIVVDYKLTMRRLGEDAEKYAVEMKAAHQRSAQTLLDLACANGGVFIKVGQHLAALGYLLPDEYICTLSVLHSRAPQSRLKDVKRVFEDDLHLKLEDVFSEFDIRPQGAASLAQVYRARLRKTGEVVAVKIQHPRVKPHSLVDMTSMEVLVHVVARLFPEFRLVWLVDEMKRNLPKELDFSNEAANAERVRAMYSDLPFLKIPRIYFEFTTDRVLTMQYCEGAQINDLDYFIANNIDRHDVCRKLGELYSRMIFVDGVVHCDPHPGNVLVHKDDQGHVSVVLLDHGLYLSIGDEFRMKYAQLWLSILKPDQDEIKRISNEMGVGELYGLFACMVTNRSWKAVTGGVDRVEAGDDERDEIKAYAAALIPQISQVLDSMPRPMIMLLKTNDLLRSIEYRLGTQQRADAFIQMTRCCVRAVHAHALHSPHSVMHVISSYASLYWTLFKLFLYERYLALSYSCLTTLV